MKKITKSLFISLFLLITLINFQLVSANPESAILDDSKGTIRKYDIDDIEKKLGINQERLEDVNAFPEPNPLKVDPLEFYRNLTKKQIDFKYITDKEFEFMDIRQVRFERIKEEGKKGDLLSILCYGDLLNDVNDFTSKETSYNIKVPDAVYRYILKSGMRTYLKKVSKYLLRKNVQLNAPTFDPDKSRAFMPFNTSFGIHVKEEKEEINIKNYLNQLPYIKGCWTRDEIYTGSYVKKAPEIMFLPNFDEGYTRGETTVPSDILLKRSNWWQHHPDGIIAFSSKEINQGLLGDLTHMI